MIIYSYSREIRDLALIRDENSYLFISYQQTFSKIFAIVKMSLKSVSWNFCDFKGNQKQLLKQGVEG